MYDLYSFDHSWTAAEAKYRRQLLTDQARPTRWGVARWQRPRRRGRPDRAA